MSTPPEKWGPPLWRRFHAFAVEYNPRTISKKDVMQWYRNFANTIPCHSCQEKYRAILNSGTYRLTEEVLRSSESLFEWTVTVHNAVNMFLHKPLMSLEEAKRIHSST